MSEQPETPNSSPPPLPFSVRLLGATSLLNDIATEMAAPAIPKFLALLVPGKEWIIGIIEGFADTVAALLKLFSGNWSDRLGNRRSFVIGGYAFACIARPFIGLATTAFHVVGIRTLDRVGKGLRAAPRDALIADSVPANQRGQAFGFHRAMDHLGAAIGPLLTLLFIKFFPEPERLRELFFLTAIPGVFILGLLLWGLREPPLVTPAGKEFKLSLQPFDARFKRYLLCLLLFTLGNSTDMFLLTHAGHFEINTPLLWCLFHIAKSGGNLICGRLVDRRGAFGLLLIGWGMYELAYVGFALANAAWMIWASFAVYAIYYSLAEPAEKTLAVELAGKQRKGLAMSWFNFMIGICTLPANLLTTWLYKEFGPAAAFSTCAALSFVASGLLLTVRGDAKRPDHAAN